MLAFSWQVATASDGRRGLSRYYADRVFALLPRDKAVLLTFLEVVHIIRSPLALFHPAILAKIVAHACLPRLANKD